MGVQELPKIVFKIVYNECICMFMGRKLTALLKPGMLQYMGSQRVRHDWATEQQPNFIKSPGPEKTFLKTD